MADILSVATIVGCIALLLGLAHGPDRI